MANERGRPRCFDTECALDSALAVFWRHGYQGASMSELTAAMGISKPSLYAAFGDKESLYLKALERYAAIGIGHALPLLHDEPDARLAVVGFLRAMAATLADPALPGGCFVVNGAADCGCDATPPAVDAALRKALQNGQDQLRLRLERARRDGQLAPGVTADELAVFFSSVLAGMGVLSKGGAKQKRLDAVIRVAMAAWPEVPNPVARKSPAPRRAPASTSGRPAKNATTRSRGG